MVFLSSRWSKIAARLPGRTDNEIKNHWNTHIKKKLLKMGIDPVTHQPFQKQSKSEETSSHADVLSAESDTSNINNDNNEQKVNNSEENSISSTQENYYSDHNDSILLDNICNDDTLLNCLWMDEPPALIDPMAWDTINNNNIITTNPLSNDTINPSWGDNCSWLLDCQDFGVHDFGFECFDSDIQEKHQS